MKDRIIQLLLEGYTNKQVAEMTGSSRSNVSTHAKRLGLTKPRAKGSLLNWTEIADFYETHTRLQTFAKFDISEWDWKAAQLRGDIISRGFADVRYELDEILIENSLYDNSSLKARIIKDKVIPNKCKLCGQLPFHNGKELTLQLDHINGVNDDHRLENLRILCPNCHTQTDTWGRKARK